jgi:uncharacterized protein (TIGR00369 family)
MDCTAVTGIRADSGADAVVEATRRLIDALTRTGARLDADADDLVQRIDAVTGQVEKHAATVEQRLDDIWTGAGMRRHDPSSGTENPLAPPLALYMLADGSLRGTVTLGMAYQGPPGLVHGGTSALLLDHALGLANSRAGSPSMTAELTLRYHRPVPLFTELTVTARRVSVDGRTIRAEGAISVDGKVCVAASGLWITAAAVSYTPTAGGA